MATNMELITQQLRANRLMKNNEQIELFEDALAQISSYEKVEHISALCQGFDDQTEHSEVMFGLIHTIEGYDRISSPLEAIDSFIQAAPSMLPHAADWLRTMLVRILNDANSRLLFSQLLAKSNPDAKELIRGILQKIAADDPSKFKAKVNEVV
ncbi:Imm30 family immunity protein [Hymenobacter terrenus]|uniref:Imm30 family immunity protein n=1 Tax=Hymenobacter terrenus TaxID=1629124 RepID=UPI00069703D8|nr:Imm30 family immunity protein [Hymenobacter terrenus]